MGAYDGIIVIVFNEFTDNDRCAWLWWMICSAGVNECEKMVARKWAFMHDTMMARDNAAEDWADHYFKHLHRLHSQPQPPRSHNPPSQEEGRHFGSVCNTATGVYCAMLKYNLDFIM